MQIRIATLVLVLVDKSFPVLSGVQEGIDAMNIGDYKTAYHEFSALAEEGDGIAMVTIGMWYHQGTGFPQDYSKAMDWYLKAYARGNGDAYNNIGVMFRDGHGVPANRSVSYALFLLTHLRGLGSESTQYRANNNLRREIEATTDKQRTLGLCMTESFLYQFIKSRGTLKAPKQEHLPSQQYPRIKDNPDLWLDSEKAQLQFECPSPWD